MSVWRERFEARLRDGDSVQVATLVLAAAVIALVTAWPTPGQSVNESWYTFAQVRSVLVALLALGYGASAAIEPLHRAVSTAAMVMVVALTLIPLEVAAYAASYPATPLWWPLATVPLAAAGYLVMGIGLGRVARALRIGAFLPLLVPTLVVGLVVIDVRFGWTTLNPLTAALEPAPRFAISMASLTLIGVVLAASQALRRARRSP